MLAALVSGCGSKDSGGGITPSSVKDAYAHELRPNKVTHIVAGIDPDQEPESSADNTSVVRSFPHDRYQLSITNTSDTGFIDALTWLPPPGMEITRVIGSTRGHCILVSTGTLDPILHTAVRKITCSAAALAPPKCSCQPGATMSVNFAARSTRGSMVVTRRVGPSGKFVSDVAPRVSVGLVNGFVEVDAMTPVPYRIPSYVGGEKPQEDLPACGTGQSAGNAKSCVPTTTGG